MVEQTCGKGMHTYPPGVTVGLLQPPLVQGLQIASSPEVTSCFIINKLSNMKCVILINRLFLRLRQRVGLWAYFSIMCLQS